MRRIQGAPVDHRALITIAIVRGKAAPAIESVRIAPMSDPEHQGARIAHPRHARMLETPCSASMIADDHRIYPNAPALIDGMARIDPRELPGTAPDCQATTTLHASNASNAKGSPRALLLEGAKARSEHQPNAAEPVPRAAPSTNIVNPSRKAAEPFAREQEALHGAHPCHMAHRCKRRRSVALQRRSAEWSHLPNAVYPHGSSAS